MSNFRDLRIEVMSDECDLLPEDTVVSCLACMIVSEEMGQVWLDGIWLEDVHVNGEYKEANEVDTALRHYLEDYAWEMMG